MYDPLLKMYIVYFHKTDNYVVINTINSRGILSSTLRRKKALDRVIKRCREYANDITLRK